METIIDNGFVTLAYYPEAKIVHHTFHRFIFGPAFREVMTKGADVFVENSCHKWLSDDRKNSALRQEDIEWAQKHWENRILEAGWEYWALVVPECAIGQQSMEEIVKRYEEKGVTVRTFSNPALALAWLKDQ